MGKGGTAERQTLVWGDCRREEMLRDLKETVKTQQSVDNTGVEVSWL